MTKNQHFCTITPPQFAKWRLKFRGLEVLEALEELEDLEALEKLEKLEKLEALEEQASEEPSPACRGEHKRVCDPEHKRVYDPLTSKTL